MIARPKISRNERKTTEIGAFEVGNFAPFCCPGAAESYVEQAAESSDLLVWQRTQDRDEDFSSPLQTLRPVSRVDYYDARPPFSNYVGELGRTARLATAPALGRRHRGGARARSAMGRGRRGRGDGAAAAPRLAALAPAGAPAGLRARAAAYAAGAAASQVRHARERPKTSESRHRDGVDGPRQLWRPGTPPFHRTWVSSPRAPLLAPEASTAADDVAAFERRNHAALELGDYGKRELVALIAAQGLDPPGRLVWDPASATMVRESLPKETYVDFCRQKFYERDPRPLVRVGRRLRAAPGGGLAVLDASAELPGDGGGDDGALYRVVSVYRADDGGARVVCYDPRTCAYGRLLLLKERLEELHVGPAPARDADYPAWSRGLVERLELGAEGDLRVGRQPLQPNGLTLDFSLSGHREPRPGAASDAPRRRAPPGDRAPPRPDAAAAGSPVVLRHPPSRHMVTQWFDFM